MNGSPKVANIGRGQRRYRYAIATAFLIFSMALAAFFIWIDLHPLWRLSLFLPLCVAVGAYFEARDQTCVVLANRGECTLEDQFIYARSVHGDKVEDPARLTQMRAQARKISLKTSLVAALLAILATILPI